ncbi:hypothetical protein BHE74_00026741 [Ensete ventricosum]|nr:hypothetical protein BHE74_00026741 [Ensete ventricosum]
MSRDYGPVWSISRAPAGPLQLRVVVTGGYDGKWVWAPKPVLPAEWRTGSIYDTGVQITDSNCSSTTKEGDDEEDGRPSRWTLEGYHWYRKRASAIDSIMSGACLLLERETYTDEERVALGAEDIQESGDG